MGFVEDKVKGYLEKIRKEDGEIKAFLHLNENALEEAKALDAKPEKERGKLWGQVIGVKSNINVKGMIANCASKTLENYEAGYDATVVERIKAEDGLVIGMLNMDEFACGSGGDTGAFGACKNPSALDRVPGGSSSGAGAAVAADFCDVAIGSDTGSSTRLPASFCGVVGVKPSYGKVSRYGLIDLSMSLDQIGPVGKNIEDCRKVLEVISGKDEKDTISRDFDEEKVDLEKVKIGVVKFEGTDFEIQNLVDKKVEEIKDKLGWKNKEVKIKNIGLAVQTYYPLMYVEFFSGTRRFDGGRYGKKIEESCGEEVLRRIYGGSEITKAEHGGRYYNKALGVKEIIKKDFDKALEDVDCLIMPTCPFLPWKAEDSGKMTPEEIYAADALTIPANLAGACAVSLPVGEIDGIPVGMQVACRRGEDGKMLDVAEQIENCFANSRFKDKASNMAERIEKI